MNKRNLCLLLALGLLILLISPLAAQEYNESPVLAAMVAAGELPPVAERLPATPIVVPVEVEIGQYGGTMSTWDTGFDTGSCKESNMRGGGSTAFIFRDKRTNELQPNILASWGYSDDLTELSMTFLEGLRWSDGAPVTSEDVVFWWEDIQTNEELFPQVDNNFVTRGDDGEAVPMQVIADDDQTFRFVFAHPNPGFLSKLTAGDQYVSPKHYLSQFHIDYNENAMALAEEAGYETWVENFASKSDGAIAQTNPDLPMLRTWVLESVDSSNSKTYVRNPYYWKVDEAGNQLPYIDRYERVVVESGEIGFARSLTGEFNFVTIDLKDVPLAIAEGERGGFTVEFVPGNAVADGYAFGFNYTHPDSMWREIFNDLRFRRAISHSFNRDEWNELFHLGLGEPRQGIPGPDTSFYVEGIDKLYIEYDVDLSNSLLDEMGLEWVDGEDYRRLPNGDPFVIETTVAENWVNKWEITKQYWAEIGVGLEFNVVTTQLLREQLQTNELPIGSWGGGGAGEFYAHAQRPIRYMPPWHWPTLAQGGALWGIWHDTGGAEGEVPPQEIQELFAKVDAWLQQPFGSEEYISLGQDILTINAENLWWFGVVGYDPAAYIVGNGYRNLPPADTRTPTDICGGFSDYRGEQFWIAS